VTTLTHEIWMPVMGRGPVGDLWGVGPKTVTKLDELGLPTIAELAAADLETLLQRFPIRAARWLSDIARGSGDTEVVTEPWMARLRSKEVTFARDLTQRAAVQQQLTILARELGRRWSRPAGG
jgi:DNA polymerase-4